MEAAFFDLDKTVIARASLVAFGKPLMRAGLVNRRAVLRALWSNLIFQRFGADEARMRRFRESALRITKGWDQALIRTIVEDALITVVEPMVYEEALAEIRLHAEAGRKVLIVSASPVEIVDPLARYLGVDAVIASRPEVDAAGRYTGSVEFYAYGPHKADAIRALAEAEGIDLSGSFAYSDSATDLPMLEAVGHPVAVNPDRELARAARERGWDVRIFKSTVRLETRGRLPRPVAAAALVAATALLAAGAVAGYRFLRRPGASSPRTRQGRSRWRRR